MTEMKISAIDIGSNSVRLAMCADGKTLYKRISTTRLGEGISTTGKLSPKAIERSAQAVAEYVKAAKEEGAVRVYAFATAAVRSAQNGGEFVSRVKELCGIDVDVISGEKEAEIGLLGALRGKDGGIIDIGGASTEITVQSGGKTVYAKSVNIGVVRLADLAGRDKSKLEKIIAEKLEEYGDFTGENVDMYGVSGTPTTLAAVKHKLNTYDPAVVQGTILTREEVGNYADILLDMPVEEIAHMAGMDPDRADIIGAGSKLLHMLMCRFKISAITVSDSDNAEGYIISKEGKV